MLEKISLSLFLLVNSVGNSIDPSIFNDNKALDKIRKEVKVLERKKELIDIIETDTMVKNIRYEKLDKDINKLKEKLDKVKKINKLKQKWAEEDSLGINPKTIEL